LPWRAAPDKPRWIRKKLEIALTLIVTIMLTVAILWPLEALPPEPEGSDKLLHFIALAALAPPGLACY